MTQSGFGSRSGSASGAAPPPGAADRSRRRRRTQAERSASTRAAILDAARDLFGRRGYAGTGREEIAAAAGMTRGALYHHFSSKAEVFEAVAEAIDAELVERVLAAAGAPGSRTARDALERAAEAYIRACADPGLGRIVIDAPSVLGPEAYRALNARTCQALLVPAIRAIASEGGTVPGDPEVLASLLLALLDEAAAAVGADPSRMAGVSRTVREVLSRLFLASDLR